MANDVLFRQLVLNFIYQLLLSTRAGADSIVRQSDEQNSPQRMWDPQGGNIMGESIQQPKMDLITTNQTVQLGNTAFLSCYVRNAADKKVTWIRQRDNHILTSGIHSYSKDDRFSIMPPKDSGEWVLQIKYVQERDHGSYECEVSTETGRYGYLVNLEVVIPVARVIGPAEHHVQSRSTIFLKCIIEGSLTPTQFLFWYRNNSMLNYNQDRKRIKVNTELSMHSESTLTISQATYTDTGNYSCQASNARPSGVNVFVSEGDKTAAIRPGSRGSYTTPVGIVLLLQNSFCVLEFYCYYKLTNWSLFVNL